MNFTLQVSFFLSHFILAYVIIKGNIVDSFVFVVSFSFRIFEEEKNRLYIVVYMLPSAQCEDYMAYVSC